MSGELRPRKETRACKLDRTKLDLHPSSFERREVEELEKARNQQGSAYQQSKSKPNLVDHGEEPVGVSLDEDKFFAMLCADTLLARDDVVQWSQDERQGRA
jgi:hypothetical protein